MIYTHGSGRGLKAEEAAPAIAAADRPRTVADLFSPGDVLRQRLRASAQLLAVVAEQTEALEWGDVERIERLDAQRQRLEREIAHASVGPVQGEPRSDAASQINRLVDQALALLEDRSEEEQRLRDWMEVVQDASLTRVCRSASDGGLHGARAAVAAAGFNMLGQPQRRSGG
jgi:hypothetical protein